MQIKKIAFVSLFIGIIFSSSAQTLFTYGTHAVSKDEFLQAYYKNPDTTGNKAEKLRQYLDLYINFRLKLQAAYDEKANTNADLNAEAENFKAQLAENFINQQADISKLVHEAFLRSGKDILLQHVFVQIPSTGDTSAAYSQISKAYSDLSNGKSFEEVAEQYSSDPAVKQSKGVIGYITVFTLPYSIENLVYSLKPGNFSVIYRSPAGYHIFKNSAERASLGRRKIQQLLFPVPPFFTDAEKDAVAKRADSVYNLLQNGTSFAALQPVFGHTDEASETGTTVEIKVGQYSGDFENEVFSLQKPSDFSKPFKTEYGYNIIKLIEINTPSADENDVINAAWLQGEIQKDGRLDIAKNNLVQKWLIVTHFKEIYYDRSDLWAYSDSALKTEEKLPPLYKGIRPATVLFEFEKKKVTVSDWIAFISQRSAETFGENQYEKLMADFIKAACNAYYREHIEDFSPSIKDQMKEFNDANMLFYVMDKHVWSKASEDTSGLKSYYTTHSGGYIWNKSITALVISGPDKKIIDEVADKVKTNPSAWRSVVEGYGNAVYADSSRFEADQLPVKQPLKMEKGFQSEAEANEAGDAFTFIHVFEIYPQPVQRSFDEARGLVINDYQQQLEQQWLDQLKKNYPVKINDTVLKGLK